MATPEGRFCSQCGTPLLSGQSAVEVTATIAFTSAEFEAAARDGAVIVGPRTSDAVRAASLTLDDGPNEGSRFELDGEATTAGRSPDSEIFLDDVTVSRRHAEVVRSGPGFLVRDLGSLNGTYVNRVRADEQVLEDGDEVQIGRFRLVFHAPRPALLGGPVLPAQPTETTGHGAQSAPVSAT